MGLQLKFNLVIAPLVGLLTALMIWADYRHEVASSMASHDAHTIAVGASVAGGPVSPAVLPEVVAGRSLRAHVVYSIALLIVLGITVNAVLRLLVLRPLGLLRDRVAQMERGHWRGPIEPTHQDELGQFVHSFQVLGLEIDALVGQSLQAERLAVLALLSQRLQAELEPDVQRVAQIAAALSHSPGAETQPAAHELARLAASMFARIRGLDRPFVANRA